MREPAIKWSGSKRKMAKEIVDCMPDMIEVYYEPFCGGCSVLRYLLESGKKVKRYICSDINEDLINLWEKIKENPDFLYKSYKLYWQELNKNEDLERKKEYFYKMRDKLNKEHLPEDFLFIMRTVTNGMPRYNKDKEFNNSFHISRKGIEPDRLHKILLEWSEILNANNVEFICQDYKDIESEKGDALYLDPPYACTKGMYYGGIDLGEFFNWLRVQQGYYLLSFDGISGNTDNTYPIPQDIYSEHKYLKSGDSSFKRLLGNKKDRMVFESLYLK